MIERQRFLSVVAMLSFSVSIANADIDDPLPDIPQGSIRLQANVFAANLPHEEVQENPVGFTQIVGPTDVAVVPNGTQNLIVASYGGQFLRFDRSGQRATEPFIDLVDPASPSFNPNFEFGQAHGLTAIAFHPGFAIPNSAGFKKFYTLETEKAGSGAPDFGGENFPSILNGSHHDNVVYEYTLNNVSDLTCSESCSKRELMRVLQPGWHHNLGDLAFDSEGLLLVSSGDGSTAGFVEPFISDNSLVLNNVFGKVLRIDPFGSNSANGRYGIPDNPFVDGTGGNVDEIYAYGFRNPYRFAEDSVTGEFYISETGELKVESIDRLVVGGNYGWNLKEGSFLYDRITKEIAVDVDADGDGIGDVAHANGLIDPVFEYDRDDGRSIIGGALYRGSHLPQLQGHYIFADFDGRLFYGDPETGQEYEFQLDASDALPTKIHSINTGVGGEIHVLGVKRQVDGSFIGWMATLGQSGDFDLDGALTVNDIDYLSEQIQLRTRQGDLTGDGVTDLVDLNEWVIELASTFFGDANLDGEFNSADVVQVFVAGEFEDDVPGNSTWQTGDWDTDGDFTTADLVRAFQAGGYESGPRVAKIVPEPITPWLTILAALAISAGTRAKPFRRRSVK